MKTRVMHTRFWQDSFVLTLSRESRLLFNYLLTNQYINISGMYELPDQIISMETGLTEAQLKQGKKDLQKKVLFLNSWVRVLNVDKYNSYRNSPKNEVAYQRELLTVPDQLKTGFVDTSIDTSIDTPINHKSEIINHKSETESHKSSLNAEEITKEIMDYWNEFKSSPVKSVSTYKSSVAYWLGEGYTVGDIKKAIDNIDIALHWAKNPPPNLTLLLRRKDKNGNQVDRIGEVLNYKVKSGLTPEDIL